MKSGTRVGLAIGVGYVLGRRRKLRKALTLAAAVAVGRMGRNPSQLARQGVDRLRSTPGVGKLAGLGGPLGAAATAAAGARIDSVSSRLRGKAQSLRSGAAVAADTAGAAGVGGQRGDESADDRVADDKGADDRAADDQREDRAEAPADPQGR